MHIQSRDNSVDLFSQVQEKFSSELLSAIAEVQQARSNFQIDHFVVGQHDTEEMQYYQTLIELQSLYYTIKIADLQIKKINIEIKRLRKSGDEIQEIDAQIREVELEQVMVAAIGTARELDRLLAIYNSFDRKYTREEIEEGQERYWEKRLYRQTMLEAVAGGSTAQAAHLDSLRQVGIINFDENGNISAVKNLAYPQIERPN
jgi:hypothetical protein